MVVYAKKCKAIFGSDTDETELYVGDTKAARIFCDTTTAAES
jgi:hypothetical protein